MRQRDQQLHVYSILHRTRCVYRIDDAVYLTVFGLVLYKPDDILPDDPARVTWQKNIFRINIISARRAPELAGSKLNYSLNFPFCVHFLLPPYTHIFLRASVENSFSRTYRGRLTTTSYIGGATTAHCDITKVDTLVIVTVLSSLSPLASRRHVRRRCITGSAETSPALSFFASAFLAINARTRLSRRRRQKRKHAG